MQDLMSLIQEAGFRGAAAQTMYAIVMAESGGNAHAYNGNASTGDNSYGLAQINMIGGMGPQRRAEFGLSSNDDLFDPLTNLKVAYALSGHGTNFSPWSTYKSGAYEKYLGQSGASVQDSGATPLTNGAATPGGKLTADDYESVDSLGKLLSSVPELNKLLDEALAHNWTSSKFQDEVENSDWWRTHSDTARSVIIQKANDPAAYRQSWDHVYTAVSQLADQLGFQVGWQEREAIASNALLTGNDSNQQWLTTELAHSTNYSHVTSTNGFQGQMAQAIQQLQQDQADYGYQWKPQQLAYYARNIVDGTTTIDTYKQQLMDWAKSAFPALAKQIDAGQTVSDLASPYIQSMSNLLEVDPGTLNLYTPAIRKALQGVTDPATKQREAVPLWQFEDQVRQDPRWQYTQNAKDTMSTALLKIGSDFGFGPTG